MKELLVLFVLVTFSNTIITGEFTEHAKALKALSAAIDYREALKKHTPYYERPFTALGFATVLLISSQLAYATYKETPNFAQETSISVFLTCLLGCCTLSNKSGISQAHTEALVAYCKIHTYKVDNYGKLISTNDPLGQNLPPALDKEQFVKFGKLLGISYEQLSRRATEIGRDDVTSYIKKFEGNRALCGEMDRGNNPYFNFEVEEEEILIL